MGIYKNSYGVKAANGVGVVYDNYFYGYRILDIYLGEAFFTFKACFKNR